MSKIVASLAVFLLFAGTAAAVAQIAASVEITNAWARATPAGAQNGAAYVTMQSPAGDRLTGVASRVAATAELHEMTMAGTVMKMREVDGVDLPAGKAARVARQSSPRGAVLFEPLLQRPGPDHRMHPDRDAFPRDVVAV